MEVSKIEEMKRSMETMISFCPTSLGLPKGLNECLGLTHCFECWMYALKDKNVGEEMKSGEDI